MQFDSDAYVVLDVHEPIVSQVRTVREKYNDRIRLALPIEITVAGSSGVGPFKLCQEMSNVFQTLDRIAKETAPIDVRFGEVLRFPNTDIFVLTVLDEKPFYTLHKRIADSDIEFTPNPFPYKPHCTLVGKTPVTYAEAAELLGFQVEDTSILLNTLSVYQIKPGEPGTGRPNVELLYQTYLSGNTI